MPYNWNAAAVVTDGAATNHGDLVTSGDYRHTGTSIACRDPNTGNYRYVKGPGFNPGICTLWRKVGSPVTINKVEPNNGSQCPHS